MGNILNTIYDDLKSIPHDLLKVVTVLASGSISAAILLKAVRPLAKLLGVLFISFSLSIIAYKAVLEIQIVKGSVWGYVAMYTTALVSYPIAKGVIELLVAVIAIVSERIKNFFKTYTPGFMGRFNKKQDNDTV